MKKIAPFDYPAEPHVRRHGPMGYSNHRQYRNWLRDEFSFRCVYCLIREAWLTRRQNWQIDHFVPKAIRPEGRLDYDNLVYACGCCNHAKATQFIPDPSEIAYGKCVEISHDGRIRPLNDDGITLIEALGLDGEDYCEFRLTIIELLKELSIRGNSARRLFGYPKNLPDLSAEPNPPRGNKRPAGIRDSCFERNRRGDLPVYY